jgi:hypothetical protein
MIGGINAAENLEKKVSSKFEELEKNIRDMKDEMKKDDLKNEAKQDMIICVMNGKTEYWEPLLLTMDSGAGNNVAPKNAFPWIKLQPNADSRAGRYYVAANGKKVYVLGEKVVTIKTTCGKIKKMRFQIADVTRILVSIGKVTEAGNEVVMKKKGGKIVDASGAEFEMTMENGVYVMEVMVKIGEGDECFRRQAQ